MKIQGFENRLAFTHRLTCSKPVSKKKFVTYLI